MKKLLLLFILFSWFNLPAQEPVKKIIIKGVIIDSVNSMPLEFVTVDLINSKANQQVSSLLSNKDGSFEFNSPENNTSYTLRLAYVGYVSKTIKISSIVTAHNQLRDLGKIKLSPSPGQLKEILITATKPFVKQEIDRVSYDVQADPESKTNDVLEMLRKVPMITVDGNDNIQLKGSSNYQIFINGKPSALMINSPSEVLKAMPAGTIKKIEVITVPPAKYDAEGITGIINIITLKKSDEGFNGNIFARYNNIFGERGSLSFDMKKDKLGLNILLGLGHQPLTANAAGYQLNNYLLPSYLSQQGQNIGGGNFNNGQSELSYEPDSLNLITATIDFINRKFARNTFRLSQLADLHDSIIQSYHPDNIGENSVAAFDIGANYQLSFKKDKNELLTISYMYASASNSQNNAVTISDVFNYNGNNYNQQNISGTKEQTFQIDFVKPVQKKVIIEVGSKVILRINSSNFGEENFNQSTGKFDVDTSLTNQFSYHQNVYSAYSSCQLKLINWTFKGGLRLENTVINNQYATLNTNLNQNYFNLVPSISIQRNFKKGGAFTAGFTERIQRPALMQLNPFMYRSNPESVATGNPALHSVLNHIIELSFSKFWKASVNASLSYSFSNNTIQNVTSLISDTVSETTYLNVGKNQSAGINLGTNYPITNKLNFSINAQLSRLWITGTYNSQFYKNAGNQGNLNAFLKYNFSGDFNTSINYGYLSGNIFLQGKSSDYFYSTIVVIKDFFKKKFTCSFTVYNPFKIYSNYSSYTKTPVFFETNYNQYYYRMFRLGLNYKFGHLNGNVKTNQRGIKNDDVPVSTSNANQ